MCFSYQSEKRACFNWAKAMMENESESKTILFKLLQGKSFDVKF